eukprot:176246-Rhodomonas_salina.2
MGRAPGPQVHDKLRPRLLRVVRMQGALDRQEEGRVGRGLHRVASLRLRPQRQGRGVCTRRQVQVHRGRSHQVARRSPPAGRPCCPGLPRSDALLRRRSCC